MGKHRGVTRTRFPGQAKPRRDDDRVAQERIEARLGANWRIKTVDEGVLAMEPGREHEQVFEGGRDPFWAAVQYAARCLRGEIDPGG